MLEIVVERGVVLVDESEQKQHCTRASHWDREHYAPPPLVNVLVVDNRQRDQKSQQDAHCEHYLVEGEHLRPPLQWSDLVH